MKLNSVDIANFIKYWSMKEYLKPLNKTQVNKLLFICYGFSLALYDKRPFDDDTPKAWPFGPVFPRVYKRFQYNDYSVSQEVIDAIAKETWLNTIIKSVVKSFHTWTASELTEWSHREGSPWYQTVYGEPLKEGEKQWNKEIPDDVIKAYFTPKDSTKKD